MRPSAAAWSFLIVVALPVLLSAVYNILATERFSAHASFVVRSASSGQSGGDMLDTITGSVSSGSTKSDSYIVRRFIESADLVRLVDENFGLEKLFGPDRADLVQRLQPWARFEDKIDYWNRRAFSTYDNTSGILTLEIQAYSATDARDVADFVMSEISSLVNSLSHQARETSYAYALQDLQEAENELRNAQQRLKHFRVANNIANPDSSAERDDLLIYELNKQIAEEKVALDVLQQNVAKPGPNAEVLRKRIDALTRRRDALREEIGSQDGGTAITAEVMSDFDELRLSVEIAKTRYVSMLDAMESARRDAEHQQRYLAIFSRPYAADQAEYPRRIINVVLTLIASILLWAIGRFIIQMIRDHRQ